MIPPYGSRAKPFWELGSKAPGSSKQSRLLSYIRGILRLRDLEYSTGIFLMKKRDTVHRNEILHEIRKNRAMLLTPTYSAIF